MHKSHYSLFEKLFCLLSSAVHMFLLFDLAANYYFLVALSFLQLSCQLLIVVLCTCGILF